MQRKNLLIAGASIAGLAALLGWAFAPRPVRVELATATIGRFETTVDADARTRLREKFVISAPLSGRLMRVSLHEGDAVEADAQIATLMPVLSPMLDERTLREQQARIGASEAAVLRAQTRIGAAKVALEQTRIELHRSEQLAQQGFVAPTKIDSDRLAAQAAQTELDTAVESEHVARHELEQARAALAAVRGTTGSAGFALRAPIAGRVLKLHHTSETAVVLGEPLIEIGDLSNLEIVADLLTADALLARPGSTVRIERWGGATVLHGRVRLVEPAAFTKVSALGVEEQRVNVLIDFTSKPAEWADLGEGFRVGVRVVTLARDDALRVPVSAVFPLPKGDGTSSPGAAVFVFDAGRARLQPVRVGGRNGSDAWVQGGLEPGARVIVYPPAEVSDGARVEPRSV